jgi:propanediol dehydratase small subunit
VDAKNIEQIVKEVMKSMNNQGAPAQGNPGAKLTRRDFPLLEKRPELLRSRSGLGLNEINLDKVVKGEINAEDLTIHPETLEMHAQICEDMGRNQMAASFRRAAELTAVPDERILEIYDQLRPYRCTKQELLDIAEELETKYSAKMNAELVREAAEVYEQREMLR